MSYLKGIDLYRVPRAGGDPEMLFDAQSEMASGAYTTLVAGADLVLATPRKLLLFPGKKGPPRVIDDLPVQCLVEAGGRIHWATRSNWHGGAGNTHFSVSRGGKDRLEHPLANCPLVTRGGVIFAPTGTYVRASGNMAQSVLDNEVLLSAAGGDQIMWIDADEKGLYASTKTGKILYTPINWK